MKSLHKTGLVYLLLAFLIILLDRITKSWAVTHLVFHEPYQILSVLDLTLAYNKGAAFSFLDKAYFQNYFLSGLAILVSLFIISWLYRLPRSIVFLNTALAFVLGGALGNLWDRWLYGHVVDFLAFHWQSWHFAIFNVADSAICLGAFMLILNWLWPKKFGF